MVTVLFAGNLLSFSAGTSCGWCGPNFLLLTQDPSPLPSGPLTMAEGSLVVSLLAVGALIGTIVFSLSLERYGRKMLLAFMAIAQIVPYHLLHISTCQFVVIYFRVLIIVVWRQWHHFALGYFLRLDELGSDYGGDKCQLFVYVATVGRIRCWRFACCRSSLRFRDCSRQVRIFAFCVQIVICCGLISWVIPMEFFTEYAVHLDRCLFCRVTLASYLPLWLPNLLATLLSWESIWPSQLCTWWCSISSPSHLNILWNWRVLR